MHRKTALLLLAASALTGVSLLVACGDDDSSPNATPDGGNPPPVNPPVNPPPPPPGSGDGGDAGDSGPTLLTPTQLASFNFGAFQLPEGLTVGANDAGAGPVEVTWAPLGAVETVASGGTTTAFGAVVPSATTDNLTLGIAFDTGGNLYAAVAASGASPSAPPGIYKFTGSVGSLYNPNATPAMVFPNGLDFIGTDLYVADSATAVIYRIPSLLGVAQTPEVYASGTELQGDKSACGGSGNPFDIGANGIIHDDNFFYVANTDKGSIVKIPRLGDGGVDAGTSAVLVQNCSLAGADGIAFASNGDILVANNYKSKIQRVNKTTGSITDIAAGPPLDNPASLWVDKTGGQNRLLITNFALGSTLKYTAELTDAGGDAAFDAGFTPNPGLLSISPAP